MTKPTVGEKSAELLQNPTPQEVGDTLPGMVERYDQELRATLKAHSNHPYYFIVVLRKKDPMMVNVMRQWFVAPRLSLPDPTTLTAEFPLYDHDVWEVENSEPVHLWTLPGPDGVPNILKHPEQHCPQLVRQIKEYQDGKLMENVSNSLRRQLDILPA